jgi:hypothetical protein
MIFFMEDFRQNMFLKKKKSTKIKFQGMQNNFSEALAVNESVKSGLTSLLSLQTAKITELECGLCTACQETDSACAKPAGVDCNKCAAAAGEKESGNGILGILGIVY